MSVPTIRDLCERATKGPWYSNSSIRGGWVVVADSAGYPVAVMEGALDDRLANAQLMARLSPDVVLAVVEALEKTDSCLADTIDYEHAVFAGEDPASIHCLTPAKAIRRALALLNGNNQPETK